MNESVRRITLRSNVITKKAETISLVTLVTLVLSAVLFIFFIDIISDFGTTDVNNEQVAKSIAQKVTTMFSDNINESQFFNLGTKDLILFFSAGNGPIYLAHNYDGNGRKREGGILEKEHYLIFERPEECEGTACVCYCDNKRQFWQSTDDEPYVKATDLLTKTDRSFTGYSCDTPVCNEIQSKENIIFANGRGQDDDYYEQVQTKVDSRNGFYPIMMDTVLLIQNKVKDDGNIFFNPTCNVPGTDDYNRKCQDKEFVDLLINDYRWEGGVVLGGSGHAGTEKEEDNKKLSRTAPVDIQLQQYSDYPGIVGVCRVENCLSESLLPKIKELQRTADGLQKIANNDLPLQFNLYYSYLTNRLQPQLKAGNADLGIFVNKTRDYFETMSLYNELQDLELQPVIQMSERDGVIAVRMKVYSVMSKEKIVQIPFPVLKNGASVSSPIIITGVQDNNLLIKTGAKNNNLLMQDTLYTAGYSVDKKTIQLLQTQQDPVIQ